MFKLIWDDQAYDELNKLENSIKRRIFNKLNPHNFNRVIRKYITNSS